MTEGMCSSTSASALLASSTPTALGADCATTPPSGQYGLTLVTTSMDCLESNPPRSLLVWGRLFEHLSATSERRRRQASSCRPTATDREIEGETSGPLGPPRVADPDCGHRCLHPGAHRYPILAEICPPCSGTETQRLLRRAD